MDFSTIEIYDYRIHKNSKLIAITNMGLIYVNDFTATGKVSIEIIKSVIINSNHSIIISREKIRDFVISGDFITAICQSGRVLFLNTLDYDDFTTTKFSKSTNQSENLRDEIIKLDKERKELQEARTRLKKDQEQLEREKHSLQKIKDDMQFVANMLVEASGKIKRSIPDLQGFNTSNFNSTASASGFNTPSSYNSPNSSPYY